MRVLGLSYRFARNSWRIIGITLINAEQPPNYMQKQLRASPHVTEKIPDVSGTPCICIPASAVRLNYEAPGKRPDHAPPVPHPKAEGANAVISPISQFTSADRIKRGLLPFPCPPRCSLLPRRAMTHGCAIAARNPLYDSRERPAPTRIFRPTSR